jgi:hypothetical protein
MPENVHLSCCGSELVDKGVHCHVGIEERKTPDCKRMMCSVSQCAHVTGHGALY